MTPQETIAHLQSQLDECRKELSASRIENEKLNDFANAKEALAWSNQVDGARLHAKLTAAETALAASQAELADMTHRFKHYSATMEAERAAARAEVGELQKALEEAKTHLQETFGDCPLVCRITRVLAATRARAAETQPARHDHQR
jgi:multidrug resistance efflux pump